MDCSAGTRRKLLSETEIAGRYLNDVSFRHAVIHRSRETKNLRRTEGVRIGQSRRRSNVDRRDSKSSDLRITRRIHEIGDVRRGKSRAPFGKWLLANQSHGPSAENPPQERHRNRASAVIGTQDVAKTTYHDPPPGERGAGRQRRTSSTMLPSGPTSCTISGIWPTAWVEHDRHGSNARIPASIRFSTPSSTFPS